MFHDCHKLYVHYIYVYIYMHIYIIIYISIGIFQLHRIDQNSSINIPSHPFSFHFSDRSRLREGRNCEPEGQWAASDWDVLGQMSMVPDKLKIEKFDIFDSLSHPREQFSV